MAPSRRPLALALAAAATGFCGLAATGLIDSVALSAGAAPEQAKMASVTLALVGILVALGALLLFRRSDTSDWSPWLLALRAYAAEQGQTVSARRDGLHFDAIREHKRYHIHVDPDGMTEVAVLQPARQGIALVRDGETPDWAAEWRAVFGGKGWELLAEVPVAARALEEDPMLGHLADRFFGRSHAIDIRHDVTGLHIACRTPPPDVIEQRLREAVEIARLLRSVNG